MYSSRDVREQQQIKMNEVDLVLKEAMRSTGSINENKMTKDTENSQKGVNSVSFYRFAVPDAIFQILKLFYVVYFLCVTERMSIFFSSDLPAFPAAAVLPGFRSSVFSDRHQMPAR